MVTVVDVLLVERGVEASCSLFPVEALIVDVALAERSDEVALADPGCLVRSQAVLGVVERDAGRVGGNEALTSNSDCCRTPVSSVVLAVRADYAASLASHQGLPSVTVRCSPAR